MLHSCGIYSHYRMLHCCMTMAEVQLCSSIKAVKHSVIMWKGHTCKLLSGRQNKNLFWAQSRICSYKNSQGPRITDGLHGLHLLGCNDWSRLAYEQALQCALVVGWEKEGEVATLSLEFEFHLQFLLACNNSRVKQ